MKSRCDKCGKCLHECECAFVWNDARDDETPADLRIARALEGIERSISWLPILILCAILAIVAVLESIIDII